MEGIQKANEFILKLIDRFTPTLTAYRSIFVPGNHDIPDSDRYYRYTMSAPQGPDDGTSIKKNDVFFVCDKERYNDRFNYFSQHLYHQIMTKPYPQLPKIKVSLLRSQTVEFNFLLSIHARILISSIAKDPVCCRCSSKYAGRSRKTGYRCYWKKGMQ